MDYNAETACVFGAPCTLELGAPESWSPELHKLIVHSSCGQMAIKATSKISHSLLRLAHAEILLALISLKPVFYSIGINKGYKYFGLSDPYMCQ